MKALFAKQPQKLKPLGNQAYSYRYNIQPVAATTEQEMPGADQRIRRNCPQYEADTVRVYAPLTANKILSAVISHTWEANYENKLINDYNAALMGLYDEETTAAKLAAYKAFLTERAALKAQVEADCVELGIN